MEKSDAQHTVGKEDRPLTRRDVEIRLRMAGSSDKLVLSGLNLREIDLSDLNLARAVLESANLSDANLSDANLTGANLSDANLARADLARADLTRADLTRADLTRANLFHANLTGANLNFANFNGADLKGADLVGADLSGADLREVVHGIIGARLVSDNFRGTRSLDESKVTTTESTSTFRVRVVEEPLTPQNLTSMLSAITDLATECWLIGKGRLADLIEYTQTREMHFVEETRLHFTRITYNSPFDASFHIDLSATNIAEGITTAIDGMLQVKQRLQQAELENWEKAQQIGQTLRKADQEDKLAQLEQERLELAIERERLEILEKRLEVQKKGIDYALEIASKTVAVLQPTADEQTKAMLIQTLLPTLLQLQNGKGLELVLPAPQNSKDQSENG